MGTREDRRRRLTAQVVERESRVLASGEPVRPRLDVAAHERPVFVEGRPPRRWMLLERERQLLAAPDLVVKEAKRSEAEAAERAVDVRSAYLHRFCIRAPKLLSCLGDPASFLGGGECYQIFRFVV